MHLVVRDFERPSVEIVECFRRLSTPTVHEVMGRTGVMDSSIRPLSEGTKMVGPAFTVWLPAGDNLMEHKAMTLAREGDVPVIHCEGGARHGATWGELLNLQATVMKLGGVVTDGTVRDSALLRKSSVPCFARAISPLGRAKSSPGSINVPIECGGVLVTPGDIVLGDDDGVVVVPKGRAEEVIKLAKERDGKEETWRAQIMAGRPIFEIAGFDRIYHSKKISEV